MTLILDTESPLEEATIKLFESLGWDSIHAIDEMDGDPTLLGRQHQGKEPVAERPDAELEDVASPDASSRSLSPSRSSRFRPRLSRSKESVS